MGTQRPVFIASMAFAGLLALSACSSVLPNLKAAVGLAVGDITVEVYIKKSGVVVKKFLCGYDYQAEVPVNCKEVPKE